MEMWRKLAERKFFFFFPNSKLSSVSMYLLAVLFQIFFFPFCIFLVPNQFILWFYNIFFFFYKYILDLREKKLYP